MRGSLLGAALILEQPHYHFQPAQTERSFTEMVTEWWLRKELVGLLSICLRRLVHAH